MSLLLLSSMSMTCITFPVTTNFTKQFITIFNFYHGCKQFIKCYLFSDLTLEREARLEPWSMKHIEENLDQKSINSKLYANNRSHEADKVT